MKRLFTLLIVLISIAKLSAQESFIYNGNPLVRDKFTADPTARVFNDRLYLYTSHDRSGADYFTMLDWCVFSTDDMVEWQDHGEFFGLDDIPWADDMAWAPDCVERGGKYYFYYPVEREKIGVAVSDNPTSGFVDSGKPLVDINQGGAELVGREPIDPTVIVEDGQAYMFFGCRDFRYVKLKDNMTEVQGEIKKVDLRGNEGDTQNHGGFYGEAPFVFKRGDIFYMVYSNGWGTTSELVYATADDLEGTFTYRGRVLPHTNCSTTHGSLVEYRGEWFVFYHTQDLSDLRHRRSVAFDRISFDSTGAIVPATITRSTLVRGEDFYRGKGRIAVSSDGNMHDNDDIQATMMTLMILAKAGLQPQTTLYTYADHIWASEAGDLNYMHTSARQSGRRFGFGSTRFVAAVENPEFAYNSMRDEILRSTPSDPLFILAAGPMQVVGEALNRASLIDKSALNNVTVVSHSDWNNRHSDNPRQANGTYSKWDEPEHSGWTWAEMIRLFGSRVNFNLISDQNGTGDNPYITKDKFSAKSWADWAWMADHSDENVRWVYSRARKNPCGPDFSDAGLAYYLVADLDGVRADQMGNPQKLCRWIGDSIFSLALDSTLVCDLVVDRPQILLSGVGDSCCLTARVSPSSAQDQRLIWHSSDSLVVRVDSLGVAQGVGLGEAFVTVSSVEGGKSAVVYVVVGEVSLGAVTRGRNFVSFEAESSLIPSDHWQRVTPDSSVYGSIRGNVPPVNNSYLRYVGGSSLGSDTLTYRFTPRSSGVYRLTARMSHPTSGREGAEVYVKLLGVYTSGDSSQLSDLMLLGGRVSDRWGCFSYQGTSDHNSLPSYNLSASQEYTLVVCGATPGLCVDYFLLSKDSLVTRDKLDLAQVNREAYLPKIGRRYDRSGITTFEALDFDRLENHHSGFSDAVVDLDRGALVTQKANCWAASQMIYRGATQRGNFVLHTLSSCSDGSEYIVYVKNKKIATITSDSPFDGDTQSYTLTSKSVKLSTGDKIRVEFKRGNATSAPEGWIDLQIRK